MDYIYCKAQLSCTVENPRRPDSKDIELRKSLIGCSKSRLRYKSLRRAADAARRYWPIKRGERSDWWKQVEGAGSEDLYQCKRSVITISGKDLRERERERGRPTEDEDGEEVAKCFAALLDTGSLFLPPALCF